MKTHNFNIVFSRPSTLRDSSDSEGPGLKTGIQSCNKMFKMARIECLQDKSGGLVQ